MQVDDIGTLKLAQLGDVGASVGYVYLENTLNVAMLMRSPTS